MSQRIIGTFLALFVSMIVLGGCRSAPVQNATRDPRLEEAQSGFEKDTRKGAATHPAAALLPSAGAALVPAGSVDADRVTLKRALEMARKQNPDLLAARQEVEVARGRLIRAGYLNAFNPEIEGGVASRRFDGGGSAKQGLAGASIELEVAGQRGLRIEEAERNLERVEAEGADVERNVVADVTGTFYGVLYLGERLELFVRIERLNGRLKDASVERFTAGKAPKLESNLAAVRHDRARKDRLEAERDFHNAVRKLERLLGVEPEGDLRPEGSLDVSELRVETGVLVETALHQRPDLVAQKREIARIEAERNLTRRLIVPNPTVGFEYVEEAEASGTLDRIFGGRISIPLPLFDYNQAELTALSGRQTQARHELQATGLTIRQEVLDAVRSFRAARKAVQLFESEAAGLIDESFGFIETSYREGKIDLLRLIVVENDLIGSRLSYLESLRDYWRARTELERAVGTRL